MTKREKVVKALGAFMEKISNGMTSQEELSPLMLKLERLSPNSQISGIIFYGERERTNEEITDEALLREEIYTQGGREAVNSHIEQLMRNALADPAVQNPYRISAMMILKDIEDERAREREQ